MSDPQPADSQPVDVGVDFAVITITQDRTEGTVRLHTGDMDPWSAWGLLLACADALAEQLPEIKVVDDDNELDDDDTDEEDD